MLGTHRNEDGMLERRKIAALTKFQLLFEIAGEIVVARELNRRTKRRVSLHKDLARFFASAGPASDLGEELEGPLAGAEIGQVQREIGIDYSDQSDVGEM